MDMCAFQLYVYALAHNCGSQYKRWIQSGWTILIPPICQFGKGSPWMKGQEQGEAKEKVEYIAHCRMNVQAKVSVALNGHILPYTAKC